MSKWVVIGDLHFGERGDSEKFNNSILDFLEWSVAEAHKHGAEKCIQLGDWFHHRNKIQVQTLNYGVVGAEILGTSFGKENTFVLSGNHDLFYLDRLDISSISVMDPYVTVIDEITQLSPTVTATPWITDMEMWNAVIDTAEKTPYLFAHLELSDFMVNDRYTMENEFSPKELKRFGKVITGHYHSKQERGNICYVGTPYPITMNEANEWHGIHIFDDETGELTPIQYDRIKVISVPAADLEAVLEELGDDVEDVTIRVEFPDDLEDESLLEEVKSHLHAMNFDGVKIKYTGGKVKEILESEVTIEDVSNIDELVMAVLEDAVKVPGVDNALLKSVYVKAIEASKAE